MSEPNVFLGKVVPALGAFIAILMYLSPLRAVLKAHKERNLGDLNPLPFSITITNTIIWMTYGLLKKDPFVTIPNAAVVVAVFNTLTAYGLADDAKRFRLQVVCCSTAVILPFLAIITVFATQSEEAKNSIWGFAGNIIALMYYSAPLSTMYDVIKTRNSASILVPLTLMNTTNATLWTAYGFAMADPFIWVPNGIGGLLSVSQIVLRLVFPAKQLTSAEATPTHAVKYSRLEEERALQGGGPSI